MTTQRYFSRIVRLSSLTGALGLAALLSNSSPASPHAELLADRAALDREINMSVNPASLFLERADLQRQLGHLDDALRDYERARKFGAANGSVSRGRARVLMEKQDFSGAAAAASAALSSDPGDGAARALRGEAHRALGLWRLAADDFGTAAALVPRRPLDLIFSQAESLAAVPENGRVGALAALEAEIERRGPASSLLLAAFEHERALGRTNDALARLDALRAQGWSQARHGLLRGDVLMEAGGLAEARAAWRSGLEGLDAMPNRRRTTRAALRLRGELLERLGGTR
ncbi:MAG: hypothetical protein AAGG01_10220 [Planctomycetota bacterium]